MKKIFLAFLLAGTIISAHAQEPKSLLTYGDLKFLDTTNSILSRGINWDANIGLGYQFNKHWTLGGNVCWGQNATRDAAAFKQTENYYRVGGFARFSKYINNSNIFFWYAQFDLQYEGGYRTDSKADPSDNVHTGIYTAFYPAIGINVYKGLALYGSFGGISYMTDKNQNSDAQKVSNNVFSGNTFKFTFGQVISLGVSKNFNTGHKMHPMHMTGDEVMQRRFEIPSTDDDDSPRLKKKDKRKDDDE